MQQYKPHTNGIICTMNGIFGYIHSFDCEELYYPVTVKLCVFDNGIFDEDYGTYTIEGKFNYHQSKIAQSLCINLIGSGEWL